MAALRYVSDLCVCAGLRTARLDVSSTYDQRVSLPGPWREAHALLSDAISRAIPHYRYVCAACEFFPERQRLLGV